MSSPQVVGDTRIDVTYYKLDLTVTVSSGYISGLVRVRAINLVDSLSTIVLDLMNRMTVDSVFVHDTTSTFTQYPASVSITLNRTHHRGEMVDIDIFYRGFPAGTGFGSFEVGTHAGTPWVWTLSEPYGARDWWPCKDHPLDKADSVDIRVTCDSRFKVGSNGTLVAVIQNGNGTSTTIWAERYPIATYLVSIALTNYAEFSNWFRYSPTDSMQILNYVLPESFTVAQQKLPKTVDMLAIFSRAYGLYPFIKEKYGHSEFGSGGAMEHQTMTSTTSFDETVIAHELSHQWFGDMITCANWPNIWLNEGFASYSESVYHEAEYGPPAYWQHIMERMALALSANGSLYVRDTSVVRNLFDNNLVYSKGAAVLHMLRHILGDTVFFSALRSYAADPRFRFGTATTEDFQQVCEAVSGKQLAYFFQEWVYGERHPLYAFDWKVQAAPNGGFVISIRIDQVTSTTNPSFFVMPVDFRLSTPTWDTTVVLFHTYSGQLFTINVPQKPATAALDPDHWILREEIIPLLPQDFVLEQNFPNPFNPATTIPYHVPHRTTVALKVYNTLGQEVATVFKNRQEPGYHTVTWNGISDNGAMLPSGVYFYRLTTEGFAATRKMLLIR